MQQQHQQQQQQQQQQQRDPLPGIIDSKQKKGGQIMSTENGLMTKEGGKSDAANGACFTYQVLPTVLLPFSSANRRNWAALNCIRCMLCQHKCPSY
jgi:hypothetical protein